MSQLSYVVMALGVLNLLVVASGLLMVFFDWTAARKREFLYLYFGEEKPGISYFLAARHRRAQYTRLLAAFFILFMRELLSAFSAASVSRPEEWQQWVAWWGSGLHNLPDSSLALAADMLPWMYLFGILGMALLGHSLLYQPHDTPEERGRVTKAELSLGIFVVCWLVFIAAVTANYWRDATVPVVYQTAYNARIGLLTFLVIVFFRRRNWSNQLGLLPWSPGVLITACAAPVVASLLGRYTGSPAWLPFGFTIFYLLIVGLIGRDVLVEYENMETSRHRLGRERKVIFEVLQRLGAATTQALELRQVLHIILESALETTEALAGAIYLYDEQGNLEPREVLNFFPPLYIDSPAAMGANRTEELAREMKAQRFENGEGVIGEVAQSSRSMIILDVHAADIMRGTTTDFMRNRSMLIVPLRVQDKTLGVIAVLNKQRGSFGRDDQSMLQALADQAAVTINHTMLTLDVAKQERLRKELQIARDIQQRLLPEKCPLVPGFEIAARATSATEVGGDYYDFFWVDENRLGIVVADVSGKGVHAALVVAMIRSAFRTQARGNPDVRDVLSRVNDFMSQDLRRDMFITCIYGILDVPLRTFTWARAGHEPILVTHSDHQTDVLRPDGFALGLIDSPEFSALLEVETVELRSGDKMLLFTDGLTEAMNEDGEEFGMERILDVMCHLDDEHPEIETAAAGDLKMKSPCHPRPSPNEPDDMRVIERAVQDHVGDAAQSDDLTIVYLSAT